MKGPHQNAAVIQSCNCSAMDIKIARGKGFLLINLKFKKRNLIMAVHACVKGFQGDVRFSEAFQQWHWACILRAKFA